MKRLISFFILVTVSIVMIACNSVGNENRSTTEQTDEEQVETSESPSMETEIEERDIEHKEDEQDNDKKQALNDGNNDDEQAYMQEKLADTYFKEIEIEVQYTNGIEYEAKIDSHRGNIKAEVEDEFSGKKVKGIDAFNFIYERVEPLSINSSSEREEVAKQIIQAFDLPSDYIELEVEVTFHNDTELKFEIE